MGSGINQLLLMGTSALPTAVFGNNARASQVGLGSREAQSPATVLKAMSRMAGIRQNAHLVPTGLMVGNLALSGGLSRKNC